MTPKSEFEQVPFDDHARELDDLRHERDTADRRVSELSCRIRTAEIKVEVLESLLDDRNNEIVRLRRLLSRSWEERLREEILASGMRVLKRLRRR
jgi:predicted  nucleic acid-binding Zn-ribbon protein